MAKVPVQFRLNGSDRAAFIDAADNLLMTLRRGLNEPIINAILAAAGAGDQKRA